ncbi:GGDEF domain-containing protein [Paenalcaligenes niemegkensis]|uniref:GGDEF domain-containing protein n=1 Tax=Paenalcaligenes niemegkensis TaxID=2895469 RepID=UPI001EE7A1A8|nr:GGDEF domain-containing protein [Paenalcaligenes niemegkensis]MCQ9615708.1 GGDEF domain-containing protein [Paenalcaligenes niemegkensis]
MPNAEIWLALSHPLVVALLGSALLLIWYSDISRPRYMLYLGVAYLAYSVAVTLQITGIPSIQAINVMLTGPLYMVAVILLTHGLIALSGRPYPYWFPIVVVSLMLVSRLYFVLFDDNTQLRFYLLHAAVTMILLHGSVLARHLLKGRSSEKVLYLSFLLLALSNTPRTLLALTRPAHSYGFDSSSYWLITQLSIYVFAIAFGLSLILTIMQKRIITHRVLSETDSLTGLRNRRGFFDTAARMTSSVDYYTILAADIDRFKAVNDSYGHAIGDAVLIETAAVIKKSIRPGDVSGRIGGEEFAIFLPDTSLEDGHRVAERLRKNFEEFIFLEDQIDLKCTISLGAATFNSATPIADALLSADRLLYQVKAEGRNRVVSASPNPALIEYPSGFLRHLIAKSHWCRIKQMCRQQAHCRQLAGKKLVVTLRAL